MADQWHHGRAWTGHDIEDACPCPQEPCGLVSTPDPACQQHWIGAGKSIRQSHTAENCPGTPTTEQPQRSPQTRRPA